MGKCSGRLLIHGSAGRRTKKEGVGNNGGHQKTRGFLIHLYSIFLINLINYGTATTERLIPEVHRGKGLYRSQTMVIDNLQYFGIFHTFQGLSELVMIHHNHLLSVCPHQVPSGNHAKIFPFLTYNRKISMPFACHHLFYIINIVIFFKTQDTFLCHKEINGNRLIDETSSSIGIVRSHHDNHAVMFRKIPNGRGNIGSLADNDAVRPVIESRQLALRTVTQNHDIMRLDIIVHHLGIGSRNHDLSFFTKPFRVSCYESCFQSFQNILKLRLCRRNNSRVIDIHIRLCNIRNGD